MTKQYKSLKDEGGCLPSLIIIGVIGGAFWLLNKVATTFANWQTLDAPYRYAVGFYHYFVVEPLALVSGFYSYLFNIQFTDHPNLNLVFSCILLVLAVCAVMFVLLRLLSYQAGRFPLLAYAAIAFILPALLCLLWFVLAGVWQWMTG